MQGADKGNNTKDSEWQATLPLLRQFAKAIERMFAPNCEVVIHDFSNLEHSIIHLEGGLSDRSIGGAATDLLLRRVRAGETGEDLYNYRNELPNNRLLKSSTIFLRNQDGEAYGALCINYDMSAFLRFQKVLGEFTSVENENSVRERLSDDVHQTISGIISDTIEETGIGGAVLTREEKVNLIARLEERGVFQVKNAAPIVADKFGFSRATIYNYLQEARGEKAQRSGNAGRRKQSN